MPKQKPKPFVPKPPPPEQQEFLRNTVFGPDSPGTVVADFSTLLNFVDSHELEAGGKKQLLPIRVLTELNGLMRWQARLQLERPQVHSYPNLQGLYLLARATGTVRVRGSGSKSRLVCDPDALDNWRDLNHAERYFSLLNAWLLHAEAAMIGERRPGGYFGGDDFLPYVLQVWNHVGPRGQKVTAKERADPNYRFSIDWDRYTFVLMAQFGLLRVEQGPPIKGRPWVPASVHQTPFGAAIVSVLKGLGDFRDPSEIFLESLQILPPAGLKAGGPKRAGAEAASTQLTAEKGTPQPDGRAGTKVGAGHERGGEERPGGEEDFDEEGRAGEESAGGQEDADEDSSEGSTQICFDEIRPHFAPYVPGWEQSLCVDSGYGYRGGEFIFKVSLNKGVWRRLSVPDECPLTDLAYAIISAYRFDSDHLWSFYFKDAFGSEIEVQHAYAAESSGKHSTDEVAVGALPLKVGDSMVFLFDFGDEWRFSVLLEDVKPPSKGKSKKPKLIDKQGKAPEQYPNWDG